MNLLTNICNPKDQHFEQESKTETFKPLGDYIFENRSMQKMRAKYQKAHSTQEFKYQSWNHPYSISNYLFQQKTHDGNNMSQQQPYNVNTGNAGNQIVWRNDGSHNKKISFKDVNMPFCGVVKQEEQGEKHFKDRDQYYTAMQGSYPSYGHKSYQQQQNPFYNQHQQHQQHQQPQQFSYQHENMNITTQSYSQSLLNKQLIQLKQENKQLKRVIEEEYKPLKQLYNKLLTEQQEREYLISKLQWKVRELVKEMGVGNMNMNGNNVNTNGNVNNNMNSNGNVNNLGLNVSKQISTPNQNYTTIEKNPFHNNNNHQQYKSSNYTNISTYFPQNNNTQRPVLNQFQPLNISTIPFANVNNNNTSYHQHGQNNNYHHQSSSYQPFAQQKTNNLSKSSIIANHTQAMFVNNHTQPIGYKNNQQFLQNVPPQQNYHHNVSQMPNFQTQKNY